MNEIPKKLRDLQIQFLRIVLICSKFKVAMKRFFFFHEKFVGCGYTKIKKNHPELSSIFMQFIFPKTFYDLKNEESKWYCHSNA